MDIDVNGTRHADDDTGPRLILRRPGEAQKCSGNDDAVFLCSLLDKRTMDSMGV